MSDKKVAAMRLALAFTMREFATVRDFDAARAMVHDALEAALAEPPPEPVAWVRLESWKSGKEWPNDCFSALPADGFTPLYTTPPTRRPLTDAEIDEAITIAGVEGARDRIKKIIRVAERAHGIGGNDE